MPSFKAFHRCVSANRQVSISKIFLRFLAAVAMLATNAAATIYYAGVAESDGEFGFYSSTSTKFTSLLSFFLARTTNSSTRLQLTPVLARTRFFIFLTKWLLRRIVTSIRKPLLRSFPPRAHVSALYRPGI
jgi:hypothetical protein